VAGHRSRTTDRIADPKLNPDVSCRRWPAHSELLAPLMNDESDRGQNSLAAKLVLVFLRGVLLWPVVPVATVSWLFLWIGLRRRGVSFGQFLGWVDLILIAALSRTVLRPLFRAPPRWVPVKDMPQVTHRLQALDPE
jgi:hypothetical protein